MDGGTREWAQLGRQQVGLLHSVQALTLVYNEDDEGENDDDDPKKQVAVPPPELRAGPEVKQPPNQSRSHPINQAPQHPKLSSTPRCHNQSSASCQPRQAAIHRKLASTPINQTPTTSYLRHDVEVHSLQSRQELWGKTRHTIQLRTEGQNPTHGTVQELRVHAHAPGPE